MRDVLLPPGVNRGVCVDDNGDATMATADPGENPSIHDRLPSAAAASRPSTSPSVGAWAGASSHVAGYRGSKRSHSQVDNCNCDDIEVPLAKRINRLNIEQLRASPGPGHGGHFGGSQPHDPRLEQFAAGGHSASAGPAPTFQESYPYSASSPYYETNHLLYHLHMERAQRMQQQQQEAQRSLSQSPAASPAPPPTQHHPPPPPNGHATMR